MEMALRVDEQRERFGTEGARVVLHGKNDVHILSDKGLSP